MNREESWFDSRQGQDVLSNRKRPVISYFRTSNIHTAAVAPASSLRLVFQLVSVWRVVFPFT
jgi:hypothetical protein